jgi:hypothetical protein
MILLTFLLYMFSIIVVGGIALAILDIGDKL